MTYSTPKEACFAWMNGLNEGRPNDVVAMYAEDSVLLPTFSPHFLKTPKDREDYFMSLAARPNLRVEMHEKTLKFHTITENVYSACGIYKFIFDVDEATLTFEARFSFVFDLKAPRPILHHHSSQVPRNLG
ncbi:MAG: DUF4440 domain-containing protein [Candidatus Methylacidiphilales bacterium]|nr:hypothetical protein [Candidatus Methylacidiphilales bacterium]